MIAGTYFNELAGKSKSLHSKEAKDIADAGNAAVNGGSNVFSIDERNERCCAPPEVLPEKKAAQ